MNYMYNAYIEKEKKTILLSFRFAIMRKKRMIYSAGRHVPYTLTEKKNKSETDSLR